MAKMDIFPLLKKFYKEKWPFPPYFSKIRESDKIHVFSKFSKNRDFAGLKAQPHLVGSD